MKFYMNMNEKVYTKQTPYFTNYQFRLVASLANTKIKHLIDTVTFIELLKNYICVSLLIEWVGSIMSFVIR
jgi:hypothetical protein